MKVGGVVFLAGSASMAVLFASVFLRLGIGNMGRASEVFAAWGLIGLASAAAGALLVVAGVLARWLGGALA